MSKFSIFPFPVPGKKIFILFLTPQQTGRLPKPPTTSTSAGALRPKEASVEDMALQSSNIFSVILSLLFARIITIAVQGESSTCLTVYQQGGAPAVFQSPKCPSWKLSSYASPSRASAAGTRCQVAMLQGRRQYQEDRSFCALDIRIPFLGKPQHLQILLDWTRDEATRMFFCIIENNEIED